MAFSGYFIRFPKTNVKLPMKYIKYNTYVVEPDQRLDLDSTRSTDGVLHRNVLAHTATRIDFKVPPMYLADKTALMNILHNAMSDVQAKRIQVEYWDDEFSTYKTGTFYIPDIKFTIYHVDDVKNDILYSETPLAFIEY